MVEEKPESTLVEDSSTSDDDTSSSEENQSVSTISMEQVLFEGGSKTSPPPGFSDWGNKGILPMFSQQMEPSYFAESNNWAKGALQKQNESALQKQNEALVAENTRLQMEITRLTQEQVRLKKEAEAFKQLWLDLKIQTDNIC